MSGPSHHGLLSHLGGGTDPVVAPWIYVGTDGVDGVDTELAANPDPYQTGGAIGPPPFVTGTNGFALDADGNPRGGLRYREAPHGVQFDCGGGITGLSPGDVIVTLVGVTLPLKGVQFRDLDDGTSEFIAQLLPSGDLVYIGPVTLDGGGP